MILMCGNLLQHCAFFLEHHTKHVHPRCGQQQAKSARFMEAFLDAPYVVVSET